MQTEEQNSSSVPSRRGFLRRCIGVLSAAAAFVVAYPIFTFIGKLPRRLGGKKILEVPLADLSVDQALYYDQQGMQIVLIDTDQKPKAYNAACTHLGCLVAWDQNDHVFRCPCHGAVFDDQGEVISGPVNKPLRKVQFEIKENKVVIS